MHSRDQTDLLSQAIAAVEKPQDLCIGSFRPCASAEDRRTDGTLCLAYGRSREHYAVQIKTALHTAAIPPLGAAARKGGRPFLLVTTRTTTGQARALHAAGIQFIDTAGNCYLRFPGFHMLVIGQLPAIPVAGPPARRAFSTSAIRLIYHYLADAIRTGETRPSLVNRPYRAIAEIAGVSLGSVASTHATLDALNFLAPTNAGLAFTHRKALLERWVAAYADRLRPKLIVGRYRAPAADWWSTAKINPAVALWGGEPAAAHFTSQLKPEVITLYRLANLNKVILQQDLRVDHDGKVEILDAFWRSPALREADCVHPLLAYADLIASGIDRNIETARILYDQRLAQFVEAD